MVGRPLAALLANDGARVFSVDIDSIQEYTKLPRQAGVPETAQRKYHPRHIVHPATQTLQDVLALSDVVVSAVPSKEYKVKTAWLKDGCVCLNVAADKNFEADVREKVRLASHDLPPSVRGRCRRRFYSYAFFVRSSVCSCPVLCVRATSGRMQ